MSLSLSRLFGFAGSGLAAAAFALPAWAVAQEEREIVIQRVVLGEKKRDDDKDEKEEQDDDDDEKKGASFWIGVALDGEGSLKIAEVYSESPALKAGLRAGDTLVAIGDKKLERLEQLVDLIQDSKGRELKVRILRDGNEQVVGVKPARRPGAIEKEDKEEKEEKGEKREINRSAPHPAQPGIAWRMLDPKAGAAPQTGGGGIQFYAVPSPAPGAPPTGTGGSAYPPATPAPQPMMARMAMSFPQSQLPDDMEVTISKKGNKPAVVTARQGEKLWKTTENELGMLPPPAQGYAARLLGKNPGGAPGMMMGIGGGMGMPAMGGMPGMPGAPAMGMPGMAPARREMRAIELRMGKDGKFEAIQDGKPAPHVKVVPGGGIQVEIREEAEGKEQTKEDQRVDGRVRAREEVERARRIRDLQEEAERLRGQLNKLREEVKEKEKK